MSTICGAVASFSVATAVGPDEVLPTSQHLATKKGSMTTDIGVPALLGTLVQTHTGEHLALDDDSPTEERFETLLADRATGQHHAIDPRLLDMLRRLARAHAPAHVELVSGYRSEKLNEMLRKKGHHVATHSQHSLGNAVDFRINDLSPSDIESELREMGWDGGVGVYLSKGDWFTHADVGPNRRWNGQ